MYVHVCHDMPVEFRGQLEGLLTLFLPCGSRDQTQTFSLVNKGFSL